MRWSLISLSNGGCETECVRTGWQRGQGALWLLGRPGGGDVGERCPGLHRAGPGRGDSRRHDGPLAAKIEFGVLDGHRWEGAGELRAERAEVDEGGEFVGVVGHSGDELADGVGVSRVGGCEALRVRCELLVLVDECVVGLCSAVSPAFSGRSGDLGGSLRPLVEAASAVAGEAEHLRHALAEGEHRRAIRCDPDRLCCHRLVGSNCEQHDHAEHDEHDGPQQQRGVAEHSHRGNIGRYARGAKLLAPAWCASGADGDHLRFADL